MIAGVTGDLVPLKIWYLVIWNNNDSTNKAGAEPSQIISI